MIKLSRKFKKRASMGLVLAGGVAVAGLAFMHHDWAGKAEMEKLAAVADDCIKKAGIKAETGPDYGITLTPLGTHYRLKTAFTLTESKGAQSYRGESDITTAPIAVGRQKAGKPVIEFKEERREKFESGFGALIGKFPAYDGKYCVRLSKEELIPCLIELGWYEDETEPGTLKSNKIHQDIPGLSMPDMALVSFSVRGSDITGADVTTYRPGYTFEVNKGGPTLDPALKQAGDAIGACHTQALESAYGPLPH